MLRIARAASSSEEFGGQGATLRPVSDDILSSMVRYSEAREEKAPSSADGVSSSDDKVRRVTVRGVGDKNVGMP